MRVAELEAKFAESSSLCRNLEEQLASKEKTLEEVRSAGQSTEGEADSSYVIIIILLNYCYSY